MYTMLYSVLLVENSQHPTGMLPSLAGKMWLAIRDLYVLL
jgi:hypothetical protein